MTMTMESRVTIQRRHSIPAIPFWMIGRVLACAVAGVALLASAQHGATETAVSAGAASVITWAVVTWKMRPVLKAATALAHAFCLTDKPCIDETRALSRAVFLAKE